MEQNQRGTSGIHPAENRPARGGTQPVRTSPKAQPNRTPAKGSPHGAPKRGGQVKRKPQPGAAPSKSAQQKPLQSKTPQQKSGKRVAQPAKKRAAPRPLTPEQKARIEQRQKARREARKRLLIRLGTISAIFLTFYIVVSLAVAAFIAIDFGRSPSAEAYPVRLYNARRDPTNERERQKQLAVCTADEANLNGSLYISYSALEAFANVSSAGDTSALTMVFLDGGDVVRLTAFSKSIYINDVPASLEAPVVTVSDEYYIPVELLLKYADGIVAEMSEDGDGNPFYKISKAVYDGPITFKLHGDTGTDLVSEPPAVDTSDDTYE